MQYLVKVLETPNSTTYLVNTVVETKQSAKAVINRYLRKYPEAYEVCVEKRDPK